MNQNLKVLVIALLCQTPSASWVMAQAKPATSQCQRQLDAAAAEGKYLFVVFYKDQGPATQAMAQVAKRGVKAHGERATLAFVDVGEVSEKELVERFGIGRAPMPLTVAVAPNGAMTKFMPRKISEEQMSQSFVTPAMAHCMKSMQEGRLVFICTQLSAKTTIPEGVKDFFNDPEFKGRTTVVPVQLDDPAEAELVQQIEANAPRKGSTIMFLAPPGVLVGTFGPTVTKGELAEALHKAGQCCDDPKCKHNQADQPTSQPTAGAARSSQNPGTRR